MIKENIFDTDNSKDYLKRIEIMGEPAEKIERLLTGLKLGNEYWQRGYIANQQAKLIRLRNSKTIWIGSLENKLMIEVDQYIRNIPIVINND